MLAITQLAAEKNLPREVVLEAVETALASAFRKNSFAANQNIEVKINPNTGEVKVYVQKAVVEEVTDNRRELSLEEARKLKKGAEFGDVIDIEATPQNAGRIAAQTAKQVVLQRLREAERELVFEEFADREGEIVTGIVQRIEPRQIILDLGRAEGVLPFPEQVRTEHYRVGQRLKTYLVEVSRTSRGPQVIVSRTHRNLLRCLLEMEVPEIYSGVVELKAIAREAGQRSKIAVTTRQPGVDPVGSCVGLRGIRIQNIVNELNGEKIDIVEWSADQATFIANALSPAQVTSVEIDQEEKTASVVVPDRHLSLAIGKEGQNARLAAKLTGWRIDIKAASIAEAERVAAAEQAAMEGQEEEAVEPPAAEVEGETVEAVVEELPLEEEAAPAEAALAEGPAAEEALVAEELTEPTLIEEEEEELVPIEEGHAEKEAEVVVVAEAAEAARAPQLRFAEDIFPGRASRSAKKAKKEKGKKTETKTETESAKAKKTRRAPRAHREEEDLEGVAYNQPR